MNREDFKKISIRGRAAFGICCLENLLISYDYNIREWKVLLDRLWSITGLESVEDWLYIVAECLPENVLEFGELNYAFCHYLKEKELNKLNELYSKCSEDIWQLVELIYNLGTAEVYSGIEGFSEPTLKELEKIIDFMEARGIELPKISQFKKLLFHDGWGKCFSKKRYSSVR